MKVLISLAIVSVLIGCTQQPIKQQEVASNYTATENESLGNVKPKENPRIAFLKEQAQLAGLDLEYVYVPDSVFSLMKDLQDGRFTTNDLSGAAFYFKDTLGKDGDYYYDSTYFKCAQVIDMGELEKDSGEKVPTYLAHYYNFQIDMTVAVYWVGTRPLQGQKLNVDFLVYIGVDTFENKKNEDRTRVMFWRPDWADSN